MKRMSRTQAAVVLVDEGASIYAAARDTGLAYSTVHAAVKKAQERKTRGTCPHCGQLMPKSKNARIR